MWNNRQIDKEARQEKFKSQSNELHSAIGEFIVEFEQVCQAICNNIIFILHKDGLRNQKLAHVILAGLTADPLRSMLQSLILEVRELDEYETKIIKNIFKRFKELSEKRNDIVHSTWYIGWASEDETDFSVAYGGKYYRSATSNERKNFEVTSQYFHELTKEAKKLQYLFIQLNGCLLADLSIKNNFILDS